MDFEKEVVSAFSDLESSKPIRKVTERKSRRVWFRCRIMETGTTVGDTVVLHVVEIPVGATIEAQHQMLHPDHHIWNFNQFQKLSDGLQKADLV